MICEPFTCQPVAFCQVNYQHLAGLALADSSNGQEQVEVDNLIGCDQYWSLITGETRGVAQLQSKTELGCVLSGPVGLATQDLPHCTLVTHTLHLSAYRCQDEQALDDRLKSFWNLETFGITDPERSVLEEFQDKIHFTGGRYEVSLPW